MIFTIPNSFGSTIRETWSDEARQAAAEARRKFGPSNKWAQRDSQQYVNHPSQYARADKMMDRAIFKGSRAKRMAATHQLHLLTRALSQ